jgi:putative heme degradation protein
MVVGRNQDGSGYSCTVSRENQMTYLFTETFTLKIEGASIEHYGNLKKLTDMGKVTNLLSI